MDTKPLQPNPPGPRADRCDRIALVSRGGGALGAYQAGVYQALHEAGLEPDCCAPDGGIFRQWRAVAWFLPAGAMDVPIGIATHDVHREYEKPRECPGIKAPPA